jgi:LuxR family maltose regulon positive regulatory protein
MALRYGEKGRRLIALLRTEALLRQDQSGRRGMPINSGSALELDGWLKDARTSKLLQERIKVIMARQALVEARPEDALALVQPIVAQSLAARRHRAWGEASLVRAAALSALGKRDAALRQLLRVIEKLAPLRMSQLIVDETGLLRGLLPALTDHLKGLTAPEETLLSIAGEMVERAGLEMAPVPPATGVTRRRQVLLTTTEINALKLAATGLPNAEIASQMLISLPTVKWHLHNVFNKFGVRSRTAAISHARQAGFLD